MQVYVYVLGRVQQSPAVVLVSACNAPGAGCTGLLCSLGVRTTTNPTPGQSSAGVQVRPLDPNQVPNLAGLVCSNSVPCAAGKCCDTGSGFCRPGTLDNVRPALPHPPHPSSADPARCPINADYIRRILFGVLLFSRSFLPSHAHSRCLPLSPPLPQYGSSVG